MQPELDYSKPLEVFAEEEGRLSNSAFSIVGKNYSLVEDILCDARLSALVNFRRFKSPDSREAILTWLFKIVRNRAIDELRKKAVHSLDDKFCNGVHVNGTERSTVLGLVIDEAIESLPADYRSAIILDIRYDLTAAEAASELGISASAYKSRLYRGRDILKKKLDGFPIA